MPQPEIVQRPEMTIAGLTTAFIHGLSPDSNAASVLGDLWCELLGVIDTIPGRVGHETYGVIFEGPAESRTHNDELHYIAGVAVDSVQNLPSSFVSWNVPAATFACFIHRGPIMQLPDTVRFAYREWLPQSDWEHSNQLDLEIYGADFCGETDESTMQYLISVVPKS